MKDKTENKFVPVKDQMFQLLLTAYCYNLKLMELPNRIPSQPRLFLLEELTALRHLANGVILHLCNLDDESSKWSLRGLHKELSKSKASQHHAAEARIPLREFRADLNGFKNKHRNAFIAHRNRDDYPDPFDLPDYRKEFRDLLRRVVQVFEILWGSEVSFGFDLGSMDPTIDFKEELDL